MGGNQSVTNRRGDHRYVIDRRRGFLLQNIDLMTSNLLEFLKRYRVITSRQRHEIQTLCGSNVRQVSALLAFVRMKSREDFEDFLTSLRITGHEQAYRLLAEETGMPDMDNKATDQYEHRHVIDSHWEELLRIDLFSGSLLDILVRASVIDLHHWTDIQVYSVGHERKVETLLYVLRKRPAWTFERFIQCLHITRQKEIATTLAKEFGCNIPAAHNLDHILKDQDESVTQLDHRPCIDRNRPRLIRQLDLDNGDLLENFVQSRVITRKQDIELRAFCQSNSRRVSAFLGMKRKGPREECEAVVPTLRRCNHTEIAEQIWKDYTTQSYHLRPRKYSQNRRRTKNRERQIMRRHNEQKQRESSSKPGSTTQQTISRC